MHKIKKGIKKKIKGKKGKKEEDDLFDPDQLAKYKEELEAAAAAKAAEGQDSQEEEESSSVAPGKSHEEDEEWKKFKALTSGVDNVLKKTTGDLDRIKSTSFFQRAPPNPAFILPTTSTKVKATPKRPEHLPESSKGSEQQQQQKQGKSWIGFEAGKEHGGSESETEEHHKGENSGAGDSTVQVEEKQPESPDVEAIQIEDDIFDTSFVDAVDSGEIKLSYVPDSPVDDGPAEDDPFDTTCATEIVKKIEEEERKKKRQVNLGIAVNVLTGGDSASSTAPAPVGVSFTANNASLKRKRRPRPHHVNLLGDDGIVPTKLEDLLPDERQQKQQQTGRSTSPAKDLFDSILGSPPPEDIGELTIQFSDVKNTTSDSHTPSGAANEDSLNLKELLSEFDVISEVPVSTGPTKTNLGALLGEENEDDLEDEFAALAAESIHKTTGQPEGEEEATTPLSPDPFDTSIVNSLLPGKSELKLIESELLAEENNSVLKKDDNDDDDFDFDPRAGEEEHTVVVINSSEQQQLSTGTLQKDLLGGSATDLSDTLHPVSDGLIETEVDDPFDTSVVEKLLPGKAELKLLEAEFLQDSETGGVQKVVVPSVVPIPVVDDDDDFDFDPRKDEVKQNVIPKQKPVRPPPPPKVPEIHPLDSCFESETAHSESVQTLVPQEAEEEEIDPFDTSAATAAILPGKLELKLLESELVPNTSSNSGDSINTNSVVGSSNTNNNNNVNSVNSVSFDPLDLTDSDFDPRASEERREYLQPISTANLISSSDNNTNNHNNTHDFLDHHSELIEAHTLTPTITANISGGQDPFATEAEELDDPFDTSHLVQSKILPGKAELNLLAKEFLDSTQDAPPPSLPVIPVLQPSTIEQSRPKIPEKVPEPHPLDEFNDDHHNSLGHVPTLQPLTPGHFEDSNTNFDDPFDTSIANTIVPGKAELKILEAELGFDPNNRRLSDPDFNPRGTIHPSCNLSSNTLIPHTVPLVPAQASQSAQQQVTEDIDPFDTSAVDTVLPGKTELKMLEAELL